MHFKFSNSWFSYVNITSLYNFWEFWCESKIGSWSYSFYYNFNVVKMYRNAIGPILWSITLCLHKYIINTHKLSLACIMISLLSALTDLLIHFDGVPLVRFCTHTHTRSYSLNTCICARTPRTYYFVRLQSWYSENPLVNFIWYSTFSALLISKKSVEFSY